MLVYKEIEALFGSLGEWRDVLKMLLVCVKLGNLPPQYKVFQLIHHVHILLQAVHQGNGSTEFFFSM